MRKLTTACLSVLATATFAACDAGDRGADVVADTSGVTTTADAAPTTAAAGDGCARTTESALEQAVGFDVIMNDNTNGNCLATAANGDPGEPTIDFRVEPRTEAFDYFSAQADATPIADLGERAVWSTLNETTGYVVVVSEGQSFVVGVGEADGVDDESRRRAEAVARLLLEGGA